MRMTEELSKHIFKKFVHFLKFVQTMQFSKPRRPLDAMTSEVKRFNHFSYKWQEKPSCKEVITIQS